MIQKALFVAFLFCSTVLMAQSKKETIVVKTPATCNHCKVCETCGGLLERDLYFVKGIKLVEYNEEAQTTTVVYQPKKITPDRIRQEIVKLGFEADGIPADPAGYAKRDGCCKNE